MNVIGLGKAGCAIADRFGEYPEYKIFKIDVGLVGPSCYGVEKQRGPEEYEKNAPSFKEFFKDIEGETIFVIGGSGDISGMCLRIMEEIKDSCAINVLYVHPDTQLLSEPKRLHEKVTYNVLQQYARSAAINKIYLVSNTLVESILGTVPIMGYYKKLNDLIVYTMHMVNIFNNAEPVMGSLSPPSKIRKICTLGIYDIEKGEEKLFFPLDSPEEISYIYGVNEERLREDGDLHTKIVSQMKGKVKDETVNVSFGVFPTNYEMDYGYVLAYSSKIQS